MEIEGFYIKNFKSIKELNFDLKAYENNQQMSNVTFLVGINESGKSALLEAITLLNDDYEEVDYESLCYKPALDNDEEIEINARIKTSSISNFILNIYVQLPKPLIERIKFKRLEKKIKIGKKGIISDYQIEIEEINLYEYIVETTIKIVGGKTSKEKFIKELKIANLVNETITKENAESNLSEDQELLTMGSLVATIGEKGISYFKCFFSKIQIWKPLPQYLINSTISLKQFKENPNISIPLKNIFHIYGKKDNEAIKQTIERVLGNQGRTDELKDKLSESISKHINKVWKEHKIKLNISINGDSCQVYVEDKDKKYTYFQMEQRSDGFKQFISLILTLSALNESDNLKNSILLIDEPEVHLHPSGARYMRDELLKIGKNNHLLIATHSHYMVDTACPQRHWIVKKEKGQTTISQITVDTPLEDDAVLAAAFGLNLYKELLPKNIIIVEGADDKSIVSHSLKLTKTIFFYTIKAAKGAAKVYGIAALLNEENIPAYVLFDDDKEGKDNKKRVIENLKESFNEENVFTLRDLLPEIPKDSSIEDLIPVEYLRKFLKEEIGQEFNFQEKVAIIGQIKNQSQKLRDDKQKLDSLKIKLSLSFIKDFNSKEKMENEAPFIIELINKLIEKIQSK